MVDPEEFSKYDSMTPTALDFLANYEDAVKRNDFQIDLNSNGGITRPLVLTPDAAEAYPVDGNGFYGTRPYSYTSYPNNVFTFFFAELFRVI
jgi:hypothetical protein